jgi:hypothetical protein
MGAGHMRGHPTPGDPGFLSNFPKLYFLQMGAGYMRGYPTPGDPGGGRVGEAVGP